MLKWKRSSFLDSQCSFVAPRDIDVNQFTISFVLVGTLMRPAWASSASLNLSDATAPGYFAHISQTYLTQIMQHFDKTQSIFSKFSETFLLPGPYRICWPFQLGQNHLSPRRSRLNLSVATAPVYFAHISPTYITFDLHKSLALPKLSTTTSFYLRQVWLYNGGPCSIWWHQACIYT